MPTDPAPILILDEIELRLANITVANGYFTTVLKIQCGRLTAFLGYDIPAINFWITALDSERNAYNKDDRALNLFIEYHALTRDDPFVDVATRLDADIQHALHRTSAAPAVTDAVDYELGETVSDLIYKGFDLEVSTGQDPWCGCLSKWVIKYQSDPFDPIAYST